MENEKQSGLSVASGSAFWDEVFAQRQSAQPTKLCVDCEHHKRFRARKTDHHVCLLRLHKIKINPVTGDRREQYTNCQTMRRHDTLCGVQAAHFSPLNNKMTGPKCPV